MKVRTSETDPLRIAAVAAGAGVVGLTLCPGKRGDSQYGAAWARDLGTDVAAIRAWGARVVVTLVEEKEFRLLGVEALPSAVRDAGIDWLHLPIRDVDVPDAQFEARWIDEAPGLVRRIAAGERVLVHCRGGLGRAGLVAATLLVDLGEAPPAAVARVRAARPGAIETSAQEQWVLRRAEGAASRRLACLLGGALGDALGYRVEFDAWPKIAGRYGEGGIRLEACDDELEVSDDTQMTLFTLEGMSRALGVAGVTDEIRDAYLDWLDTQGHARGSRALRGRLAQHGPLRHRRAPGNTCLRALEEGGRGTAAQPVNDSKGCGGVMRTAPLGFLPDSVDDAQVFRLGVEAAALTHGHADGFLPAGAMAVLVRDALEGAEWRDSILKVISLLGAWPQKAGTTTAIERAASEAAAGAASRERLAALGAGWVGEEALAVALYSVLASTSFLDCIALAANHGGDSDSTASIAGQLWGARHGLASIPLAVAPRLDALGPLLETWEAWERRVSSRYE